MNYIIVTTTTSTKDEAKQLASILLEKQLAACIQINPIESIYRWKGEIECEEEFRLTVKSKVAHYKEIEKSIKENHSYELPQIVMKLIDKGSDEYLKWIDENIK